MAKKTETRTGIGAVSAIALSKRRAAELSGVPMDAPEPVGIRSPSSSNDSDPLPAAPPLAPRDRGARAAAAASEERAAREERLMEKVQEARAVLAAMPLSQQELLREEQRLSWVRGEMALGTDADEAEYRKAVEMKNWKRVYELKRQGALRMRESAVIAQREAMMRLRRERLR